MIDDALVARARALAPDIAARADEIEQARRMPMDLVARLDREGLFRLCVPRALGGLEAPPATTAAVIEALSRADGATGWCVMIGATSGIASAYLEDEAARAIYGTPPAPAGPGAAGGAPAPDGADGADGAAPAITGGVLAPFGRAQVSADGYRVTGRWAFASGCQHCHWLMGGSIVVDDQGAPRLRDGVPENRLMFFPASQVTIHDTWDVAGLCGTGSHDMEVRDCLVPLAYSASIVTDRVRHDGPLFRFPVFGLLAASVASVALGIGRAAVDELIRLARSKRPAGGHKALAERSIVQHQVVRAEAILSAARALLFEAIAAAHDETVRQGEASLTTRAALRRAACHATTAAARATDLAYHAGGGTAIYAASPLQRYFRDVHVATQHAIVGTEVRELVGRVMLGVETSTAML